MPLVLEKALVFAALYAFWAAAYFGTSAWNAARPAAAPAWDPVRHFLVVPAFVWPYLSAFVLPFLAAAAFRDRAAFRRFAVLLAAVIAASAAAFLLVPLVLLRPPLEAGGLSVRVLAWLRSVDAPVNLFPSLHVSLAFLFAAAAGRERPRLRPGLVAWAALVAVSALLIRQHYLVDVIGGAALGWAAWALFVRREKKNPAGSGRKGAGQVPGG